MSEAIARKNDAEALVLDYVQNPRPDLKDLIILQYAGLVERIARRFSGVEPIEDLAQVGYIGLLNALSKFDPANGVRFNTYATHLVAGEIKHYLRDKSQIIRHPAWVQELRHRLNKAALELQVELGRQPTDREVAEACKVSEQAVREVAATQELLRVTSLDAPIVEDDDGDTDFDKLDSSDSASSVSLEDRVVLESAIQQLRELEREVVVMFHFDSLNQTEIAARLGISCNYVSHILRQSMSKLRKILVSEEEADLELRADMPAEPAVIDPLTGIYSERYFLGRLTEETHRVSADGRQCAVVRIDFHGLKAMASFYGDSSVRDFLADVADCLKSIVRSVDVVCRFGEHGFAVVLPNTGSAAAVVRQRLEQRLRAWLVGRVGPNGALHLLLGHAVAPDDGRSVERLLKVSTPLSSDDETSYARAA